MIPRFSSLLRRVSAAAAAPLLSTGAAAAVLLLSAGAAAAAPLAGTYVVGSGGDYATLSAAGAALIANGVSAPVTFQIKTGTYSETLSLTAIAGVSSTNRVTFTAQSGVATDVIVQAATLTNTGADSPILLNGAQFVTITQITLQSSSSAGSSGGGLVWLAGNSPNNTVSGCVMNTVGGSRAAVHTSPSATVDNLQVVNCQISLPLSGCYGVLIVSPGSVNNVVVQNNVITCGAGTANTAIYIPAAGNGLQIVGNTMTLSSSSTGINFGSTGTGAILRANRISGGPTGMSLSSMGSGALIANNMVQSSSVPITMSSPAGVMVAFNSFYQTGGTNAALTVNGGGAGAVTLRDNVLANSVGGPCLVSSGPGVVASPDYNDYYTTGVVTATISSTNYASLAALQSGTGFESHGIAANPGFVSSTDLHARAPALNNAGAPLGSVLDDIDGDVRSLTTPDIGADEFSTSLTPLVGTYTVGASGTYATPAAAAADLNVRGVSGPVSFLIQSGTYTGTIPITTVTGANAANRVRFVSQSGLATDVVLQAPALATDGSDAVLNHQGARYVDVDSLTIQTTTSGSSSSGGLVFMLYGSNVNRFQGCRIIDNNGNCVGIRGNGAAVDSMIITGCQFTIASTANSSYAVQLSSGLTANGLLFSANSITTSNSTGIGFYCSVASSGLSVLSNTISMGGGTGILLQATSSANTTIRGNKVTGVAAGISASSLSGTSLIANNFLQGSSGPISLNGPSGTVTVAFNSLLATGSTSALTISGAANNSVTLRNNIYACPGGAVGSNVGAGIVASADYDDYYTTGALVATVGGTSYNSLPALLTGAGFESHGVLANPGYVSATDLHARAPSLDGAGTPLAAVLDDIDGQTRSLTAPDIGADEFSAPAPPMAGTYTVGASGTYATLVAAVADAEVRGISAPVSFLIQPGTYTGTSVLTPVAGSNPVTRLRLVSQSGLASDVILQAPGQLGDGSDAVLQFAGGRYVDVDSLTFQPSVSSSSNGGALVMLTLESVGNRFQGCTMTIPSTNTAQYGIRNVTGAADSIVVQGCQFNANGGSSYGVILNSGSIVNGVTVLNNSFNSSNGAGSGFGLTNSGPGTVVQGNTFNLNGNNAIAVGGSSGVGAVIRANRILSSAVGIQLTSVGNPLVANNMVQSTVTALNISSGSGATVVFNTLLATGPNATIAIPGGSTGATIKDNVIAQTGGGLALSASAGTIASADYNDYYGTGANLATIAPTSYPSFYNLQIGTSLEPHGLFANPGFVSATDLHNRAPALNNAGTPIGTVLDDIDGNVRSLSTPDIGANEFTTALTPMAGTYTVGASGTYATPIAAVADVELRGISAPVSFSIQPGTYSGTIVLTPVTGANFVNRVQFTSSTGVASDPVLQANATLLDGSDGILMINGARYVDFNQITIKSANTGGQGNLVTMLGGCIGDRFQNCVINALVQFRVGVRSPGATIDSTQFTGNQFLMPGTGSYAVEITTPGSANGTAFIGNTFTIGGADDDGIYINCPSNGLVIQNQAITMPGSGVGIALSGSPNTNTVIRANHITGATTGMNVAALSSALIANNMIQATNNSTVMSTPISVSMVFNSLNTTGGAATLNCGGTNPGSLTLENNVLSNSGGNYPLALSSGITELNVCDYNDLFSTGANLAQISGTPYATLAAIRGVTGQDAHDVNISPAFTSQTDLHTMAPGLDGKATPIAAVLDDIDGQLRNATTPDIGADEFTIGSTDVTPPNTSITAGSWLIGNWSNSSTVSVSWAGIDDVTLPANLRFEYNLDGAAFSAPTYATSNNFSGLAEGSHTVAVAAIDEAGNVDPTPATATFTVDLTAPDTQILTGPAEGSTVSAASAVFTIAGTDNLTPPAQLAFSYSVDGGSYSGTATTISLTSLANGAHTLQVRATDLAGNVDATPATRHFTIATIYDLTADFSDAANSSGPWTYHEGANTLAHVANFGDNSMFTSAQPAWARAAEPANTAQPAILRVSSTLTPGIDLQSGDVAMYSTDPTGGVGGGPANVTWTAPFAASLSISGAAWMARDITRGNHWAIYLNGTQLTAGDVASGDPYSRSAPFSFSAGSGGASALNGVLVGAGDVIKLQVTNNTTLGDYTGVQMQVQAVTTNGTPPKPVILAGPAASGWSQGSTAFTWTLGAHSEPASTVRYATRLDAGLTSAFAVDTTLALSALAQGPHTLWIIARDDLALRDSTSRAWTVDVTAPTVSYVSGPVEGGYSTANPVFGLGGTDNLTPSGQLRYAYSLDAGAFSAPQSSASVSLTSLSAGAHTLAVHSLDLASNASADATRHWTVDGTPPETQITSGPANASTVGTNSVTFGFTGTDNLTPTASLSYQTQLDGGAWSATAGSTIAVLSNLADGPHVFNVRAVDLGGNVDPTPATRSFTVDAQGPVITILTGPASQACLNTTSTSFTWSATDVVTPQNQILFATQLDASPPTAFGGTTSLSLGPLAEGQHTLTIQSEDGSGHVTSLQRTFQVDITTPVVNAPTTRVIDNSHLSVQCSGTDVGGITGYRLQISTDPAFSTIAADVALSSAGSYTYAGTPGASYYARANASDCAGNTSAFSGPSNVATLANLPNLVVTAVNAPPTATGGLGAQVSFTVSNTGLGATNAPSWNDWVYLSPSATYNSSTATLVAQPPNLSVLGPGESYTSTANVNIPIGTSGTWYLLVEADGGNAQAETDNTDNFRASAGVAVTLGAFADLHVISVTAPPTALSSDVVNVSWTERNDGTGRTNATDWWDTVLLSTDTNFDYSVLGGGLIRCIDQPLAQVHHVGALDPGASYTVNAQVQLPGSFGGKRYILVAGDLDAPSTNAAVPEQGNVFENQLDINIGASDSVVVTQEQPSDLTVDAVSAPATGASGGTVAVTYTVGNHGFNATPANTGWNDKVWFSADNTLDASDVLMGTFAHTGVLALGSSYTTTANLPIPQGFTGTYYVIVQTDANNSVPEFNENNNAAAGAQTVAISLAPWPNLVPTAVSVSDTIPAGGSGTANWTVANTGVATASATWSDYIELGISPVWTSGLTVVGQQRGAHTLATGQSYPGSATLTVPTTFSGLYYAFAHTDAVNEVYEYSDEGDNVVPLGAVFVPPHAPVDLVVSNLTAPASATGGQPLTASWSVTNQGAGSTLAGSWAEDVWLSNDATYSSDDVQLASPGHSGTLSAGGHYSRSLQPTLPSGLNGTYYVIVRTDPTAVTGDANTANNVVASGPISITSPPPPNLTAANVAVGPNPVAGQPVQVSFDIHNVGSGPVPNSSWSSAVYLSQDPWLDASDVSLGTVAGTAGLAAGGVESHVLNVTMPSYASGPYYIIVMADSHNDVYENGLESDNTAFATTLVTLPPPADLVVQNVQVPGAAVPGQSVTVNFTLVNQGANPAVGVLSNAVYVSSDTLFDATTDPLVGVQQTSINLAPLTSVQMAMKVIPNRPLHVDAAGVTSLLPPISPGSYFAIVRANILANIRELVSDNNTGVSGNSIATDVPALTLGTGAPFSLTAGQTSFYKVSVPAGVDLTFGLSSNVPDATDELYVAYNRVPQLTDFDFTEPGGFTANPTVLVPQTQAGTYYVMAVAHTLGSLASSENVTLAAQTLPFSMTALSPTSGGAGRVTMHVQGAGLRDTTTFDLELSGIPKATGAVVKFNNSTDLLVRFDLTGVLPGTYDLVARNGGSTVVMPSAFSVQPPQPIAIAIVTQNADVFRRAATGNFTVKLQNTSNQDVPIAEARVLFPATSTLKSISSDPGIYRLSQIDHGLASPTGDVLMLHHADGSDSLSDVELMASNLAPGESRAVTLAISGFASSPYSVRVLAAAMTMQEFLNRQAAAVEAARRALLANPVGLPDSLPILAADPYLFRDRTLRSTYVLNGVIDETDLALLPPHSGTLPAAGYPEVAGPQGLLDDLAAGGACPQPSPIPECKPDAAPPGTALPACTTIYDCDAPVPLDVYGGLLARVASKSTTGFDLTKSVDVRIVVPCDPNLMTGPAGFGSEHWVNATTPMSYRVDFENLPGVASAPAQVVHVTVPIDPSLDITTFRVGEMGFGGSHVITVPPNRTSFSSSATYPDIQLTVVVTAGINPTTRLATWTFSTIDPNTGNPPTDPNIGFLPVNNLNGFGTGYVTYTAQPNGTIPSGSSVTAQASIQFDVNTPIPTVAASNRVDDRAPTSLVLSGIQQLSPSSVLVTWKSADDTTGAGLAGAALWMKTDTGTFAQVGNVPAGSNSLTVPVVNGHYYGFYSLASDNAGNVEPGKSNAEAALTVGGAAGTKPILPRVTMLHPNYPNPFRGSTTIWFDLATSENVTLEVFDLQGRRVLKPFDAKPMQPGMYRVELNSLPGGPGVYFYRLHAGAYEHALKLVMLR